MKEYNIEIMGKYECEMFSEEILDEDYIIISINDTGYDTDIAENKHIVDCLKLWFDDIESGEIDPKLKVITIEDAEEIKEFIDKYKDSISNIVVHCTAGISRSGAVGCIIARYLNGDDVYLLETGKYIPNKLVYKTMSETFNLKYSESLFREKKRIRNGGNRKNLRGYGDYGISIEDMFNMDLDE
jgi:predicted protein tyrosine phosphatase